ncbi:MAG TPA: PIG-L family deacetylase [Acidimicrobiia bacterium]|nr:PIG-L family deacetylase [Acidimicrobiia bacterium]
MAPPADLPPPARALAIGAHPDDVEFGCGATLAKWAARGAAVTLLVLTDGSKGTWDRDADLAELVASRHREQHEAGAVLGLTAVEFLDLPDGELRSGLAERALVCEAIRRLRPEVVLGHDPWKRYRLHPDHRHAGWLTLEGVVAARDHHFFPEQRLPAHRPGRILLFEAAEVDHLEPVGRHLDAKIRALLCHRSQWPSTMRIDAAAPDGDAQLEGFVGRVREEAETAGRAAGVGPAEGFKLLDKV